MVRVRVPVTRFRMTSIRKSLLVLLSQCMSRGSSRSVMPGLGYDTRKCTKAVLCSDNHPSSCRVCNTRRCNT